MQCIAGFYASEAEARSAALDLAVSFGLLPTQIQVLSPAKKERWRFALHARHWSGRWPFVAGAWTDKLAWMGSVVLLAVCVLGGAVGAFGVTADDLRALEWYEDVLGAVATVTTCAALWIVVMSLLDRGLRTRHFDAMVRARLQAGGWAVVVSALQAGEQPGVLSLLQRASLGWTASAGHGTVL